MSRLQRRKKTPSAIDPHTDHCVIHNFFCSFERRSVSELTKLLTAPLCRAESLSGIYMVLEMRDGDKSKLLDKGIQKAVVNINDIITHRLLKMDVW